MQQHTPEIPNISEHKELQKHERILHELVKDTESWCFPKVPKAAPAHIIHLTLHLKTATMSWLQEQLSFTAGMSQSTFLNSRLGSRNGCCKLASTW